jgi:hypothetical protein
MNRILQEFLRTKKIQLLEIKNIMSEVKISLVGLETKANKISKEVWSKETR